MTGERVVPLLVSVAVIVLVAIVQERSRYLAALLATMPLTAPLAIWIVFSATRGDHQQTAAFAASMLVGLLAGVVFVVVCWLGLRQAWSLPVVLVVAGAVWLAIVGVVGVVGSSRR